MQYSRFNNKIVARIDKGEEILTQLLIIAERACIELAAINGIGATDDFTVGVFKAAERQYVPCNFRGDHEIISLIGTITAMNGKPYAHVHMSASGEGGVVVGGHLTRATVSVTCEVVIDVIQGLVDRKFDETIGINRIEF